MEKAPTAETLLKAIRAYCLQCSGGCRKEVERCGFRDCALYHYRLPDRPEKRHGDGKTIQTDFLKEMTV